MRRATRVITLLAVLGLVGLSLSAPAYAEGPRGNPTPGITNPGNPGPEGNKGPNGSTGANGPQGPNGSNGPDGSNGPNNAVGAQATNGNGGNPGGGNPGGGNPGGGNPGGGNPGGGNPGGGNPGGGNPGGGNPGGGNPGGGNPGGGNPGGGNPGGGNPGGGAQSTNGNENANKAESVETTASSGNGNKPEDVGKPEGVGGGKPESAGGDKPETAGAEKVEASGGGKPENDMSGKSSGPAAKEPPGNNGTIKVHQNQPAGHGGRPHGDVEVRNNMPHVRCTFHLYGFHFDANDSGTFRFEHWSPTGSGSAAFTENGVVKVQGTWSASAQGDWVSGTIQLEPGTRDHSHGSHYKLWFQGPDGHAKMKVFWQEPCEAAPPPPGGGQDNRSETTVTVCIEQPGMDIEETTVTTTVNGRVTKVEVTEVERDCGVPDSEEDVSATTTVTVCIEQEGMDIEQTTVTTTVNGETTNVEVTEVEKDCGVPDITAGGDDQGGGDVTTPGGVQQNIRNETVCIGNMEVTRTFVNEQLTNVVSTGRTCQEASLGQQNVRSETVCIENMLVTRTFVNEQLTSVASTGAVCVLGVQTAPLTAPLAGVSPIVEAIAPIAQQLGQQLAGVLGMLPSSATAMPDDMRLAIAGLALLGAAFLLLRRRARRPM